MVVTIAVKVLIAGVSSYWLTNMWEQFQSLLVDDDGVVVCVLRLPGDFFVKWYCYFQVFKISDQCL